MTEERQDFGGLELEKNMLGHRNQGCINEESDGLQTCRVIITTAVRQPGCQSQPLCFLPAWTSTSCYIFLSRSILLQS